MAAGLHSAGRDVLVIARGEHGARMRKQGLQVHRPDGTSCVRLTVTTAPLHDVSFTTRDIVLLAVKTQDCEQAIRALARAAFPTLPVVCLQNGLESERIALRRFERVIGANVMVPATHLEPGVVVGHSAPSPGIIDVGRHPAGLNHDTQGVALALRGAGFDVRETADIGRWKRAKLLQNLGNAVGALCGTGARAQPLLDRVRAEGRAVFAAAGLDHVDADEYAARRAGIISVTPVGGHPREGSSTWQSLARGLEIVETDYLNGEIVLLGRTHAVPTPANALVCRAMAEHLRRRARGGTAPDADVLAQLCAEMSPE